MMALSMDEPYVFFQDVMDASGVSRQLQTTKLKYFDSDGRLCVLGMCQDVTDMVRIQREDAKTKEDYEKTRSTGILYSHISQALARGYTDLYYVNIDSEEYIKYRNDDEGSCIDPGTEQGICHDLPHDQRKRAQVYLPEGFPHAG